MLERHTRNKIALAVLLAGALALPGLAAAHGDRDREDGPRSDWHHERGGHDERDGRGWGYRDEPRYDEWHGHRHHHHHRPDVVVVERPVYRRYYAPPPPPVLGWGNGISVILQRSW